MKTHFLGGPCARRGSPAQHPASAGCRKVGFTGPDVWKGLKLLVPRPWREGPESLRVFGRLPDIGVSKRTEAGVRKASREETAGGVRTDAGVGRGQQRYGEPGVAEGER